VNVGRARDFRGRGAMGAGFVLAALTVLHGSSVWRWITAGAAISSLVLSVVCWPGSLLGVPINLTILAMLPWRGRPRSHPRRWA